MKPPALRLLARVLNGPDTDDAATLAGWASTVRHGRRDDVVRYVALASAGGQLGRDGGHGSLKHLLWWLRDHGGALYEPAAIAVLGAALTSTWPLAHAGEALRDHPLVAGLVAQALNAERSADLARHLTWETMPAGVVAWNRTTLNLSKVALAGGADYYAAVSDEGGCLMARRGLTIEGFPCAEAWRQPYPNLVVLTRPGRLADEATLRAWLTRGAGAP